MAWFLRWYIVNNVKLKIVKENKEMKLNSFDEVRRLTTEMVAIPSINKEPGGETAVARYIYDYYMSLDYFKAHPDYVKCFQTKNDFVERHSTYAYVKGTKGSSNRTVIIMGHLDTVGVDDFGTIREYAFKCDELPEKLKETFKLSDEVIADIESGEYLFGRGALDMKSGVAGQRAPRRFPRTERRAGLQ